MPTTLIIVAAVAILIILLATASYKVCPADRVMVITGPGGRRFVSGGSAFIIPFIMRVDWLSLGAVQSLLRTDTPIPTKDAILIDVNAVANFQIASETMTVDENGKQVKALENAAKNYLNQSKERMEKDVTQVLLGKLREVIGKTELKELMENRDTFAATVAESARVDMERLGLQLTTFNIQDFTDRQNVIANMGAEMAAEISRNAKLVSYRELVPTIYDGWKSYNGFPALSQEGSQYEYFQGKVMHNYSNNNILSGIYETVSGSAPSGARRNRWWERSPYPYGSYRFLLVYSSGDPSYNNGAYYRCSVVPAFSF